MAVSKPCHKWSELNDMAVIEAMRMDNNSKHWNTCSDFIRYFIEKQFPNLLDHHKEEAVQETLLSVHRGLPAFHHRSKFTTWLSAIARNRAIDALRKQTDITQWEIPPDDTTESREKESASSTTPTARTPEEIALAKERIREVFAAIEAFLQQHAHTERNRQILYMVLFEGYSYEEVAKKLGVHAPVIGYVVRSARDYVREALSHGPESHK